MRTVVVFLLSLDGAGSSTRLSLKAVASRGRRACLTAPVAFPDGAILKLNHEGTLTRSVADGDSQNVFEVDVNPGEVKYCFEPPPQGFRALEDHLLSGMQKEERLLALELLAQQNAAAGRLNRNVSMLEQTMWNIHGLGVGLNLSFVNHLSKHMRLGSLAACSAAMVLRRISACLHPLVVGDFRLCKQQ
eukprot:5834402-Amphidinium_carterae.1